jgi:tetratricopeptide (TPR) repeat protein
MIFKVNGSRFSRGILFLLLIPGFSSILFSQENHYKTILNEVVQLLASRNYSSALRLFDNLPPEDAENTPILLLKASILNSAGRTADAKQIADRIISADSNNTEALMVLADAAALEGKDRDRRNFLEKIIVINPGHARALTDLGNISLGNQNLYVAAGYFDRALSAEPDNGEALVGRAVVYRYQREQRKSEQLLNRAANLYPGWARPLQERARLYRGARFFTDALQDLDDARKLEPDNYWINVDHGLVLMDMDRKKEALEDFICAIEIDPGVFIAYVYSAGIKEEFGDYDGAQQDYIKLTSIRPDYYFGFEALGILLMKKKQWAQARDAFLDAFKQTPKEYTYALLASVCWMRSGRQTDPRPFLAQTLRTAPRDTLEYSMLKLYHDLSGDLDVVVKVENEKDTRTKARMLFYLASYYDIRGSRTLADRYYLLMQDTNETASAEWQINEWTLKEKGLGIRTGNE